MAAFSSVSRASSETPGCCDAPIASETDEEQHFLLGVAVPHQGLQQDQSLVELALLYQRLGSGHVGTGDEGGLTAAFDIGAASSRKAPAASARRKGLIVIVCYSVAYSRKKRGWQNLPPSSRRLN